MVAVRDVREFAIKNQQDLVSFIIYKTGILDQDLIMDQIQDFYIRLIRSKALDKFDSTKGSFESYIFTLLCWMFPVFAKKVSSSPSFQLLLDRIIPLTSIPFTIPSTLSID